MTIGIDKPEGYGSSPVPCSPFWYGIGAFFLAPVAALFCLLMGAMMILAWPFIPFLCYMQRKEEISKATTQAQATQPAPNNNEN